MLYLRSVRYSFKSPNIPVKVEYIGPSGLRKKENVKSLHSKTDT